MPLDVEITKFNPLEFDIPDSYPVYQRVFGMMGGYPQRSPQAWQKLLVSIIYAEIPMEFSIACLRDKTGLRAYAILGFTTQQAYILELTAADQEDQIRLLHAAADLSRQRQGL